MNDNNVYCQKLLLNTTAVNNNNFQATTLNRQKSICSHEIVRANDTASDSTIAPFAVDTSCNRRSAAHATLNKLEKVQFETIYNAKRSMDFLTPVLINTSYDIHVPITDPYASHNHCTLNCVCDKSHDILYHGTMYPTPLNNARFSIDLYNVLIASIYLHQYFYVLEIMSQSADYDELYHDELYHDDTIYCPSFSLVR